MAPTRSHGGRLVSHARAFLLTELVDRSGLTATLSEAMVPTRERRSAHDPGRVLRDLVVATADGSIGAVNRYADYIGGGRRKSR